MAAVGFCTASIERKRNVSMQDSSSAGAEGRMGFVEFMMGEHLGAFSQSNMRCKENG
jgi:hypothetical protein